MSEIAQIQGDNGQIGFEILGYENNQAQTTEDANWLRAVLHIKAGPFSGSVKMALTTSELVVLYSKLVKSVISLRDVVEFSTMEGNLSLRIEFGAEGRVSIRGVITPDESEENAVHYGFHTDPITLERSTQEFARLVSRFPVKTLV
jgi:hypothetical protein